jgi:hypothetical protein
MYKLYYSSSFAERVTIGKDGKTYERGKKGRMKSLREEMICERMGHSVSHMISIYIFLPPLRWRHSRLDSG